MTYYEELGVPTTASSEEIRQAYKDLARLMHPDQCRDAATRRLADLQMKRLNGILEILQDTAGRERYDRSLSALALAVLDEPPPPTAHRSDMRWTPRVAIAAAATILLVLLAVWPSRPPASAPLLPQIAGAIPGKASQAGRQRAMPQRERAIEPEPEWEPDWEPLATYTYESHVPIPPLPFPGQPAQPGPAPAVRNSTPARCPGTAPRARRAR